MMHRSKAASLLFASAAIAAGAWAFNTTQSLTKDMFDPILEACTQFTTTHGGNMDAFTANTGFHAFDTRVGMTVLDPFVCLITQFLYMLAQHQPAGLLAWGELMCVGLPMGVWTTLEAGRQGNGMWLLYPTVFALAYQFLGVSVVFPAVWIPAYCFTGNPAGAVSPVRAKAAVFLLIPGLVLSILVFVLDTTTPAWSLCAGILGGPLIALAPLLLWRATPPELLTPNMVKQGADAGAQAFAVAGMVALVLHVWLMYETCLVYRLDYKALWADLWTDGHPAVQFMTVDAGILYVGMMIGIAYKSWSSFGETLLMTPIFGPGGACAMTLAALEMESASAILRGWASQQHSNITAAMDRANHNNTMESIAEEKEETKKEQ